jgi:hypothetical protein
MDDWVERALQRWPNVPALFDWLGLDRRGRWLIQGEPISHPRIVTTINRNYAGDAHGRWYFQNGPQRGYMQLESTPLILRVAENQASLVTHTGLAVEQVRDCYLDEEGAIVLLTEHGAGEVYGADLGWMLERLTRDNRAIDDDTLAAALEAPSGFDTDITLSIGAFHGTVRRLNFAEMPAALDFERHPAPRADEKVSTRTMD